MFAASRGISSRIVGSTRRKNNDEEEKKKKVPLRQRLYVPCMWPTCASCIFGLIIFAAGMMADLSFFRCRERFYYRIHMKLKPECAHYYKARP